MRMSRPYVTVLWHYDPGKRRSLGAIHCLNALLKLPCKLLLARVIQLLNTMLELRSQPAAARICKGFVA